jgi:hypothetical protein
VGFERKALNKRWYPRPELNRDQRFRKPPLYPFELREHNARKVEETQSNQAFPRFFAVYRKVPGDARRCTERHREPGFFRKLLSKSLSRISCSRGKRFVTVAPSHCFNAVLTVLRRAANSCSSGLDLMAVTLAARRPIVARSGEASRQTADPASCTEAENVA